MHLYLEGVIAILYVGPELSAIGSNNINCASVNGVRKSR